MKVQFLQHEYTWSNHCITGNKLGWGICASSSPGERPMLKELEKLAGDTEPDRSTELVVEEMIYSPIAGFVRLFTSPLPQGEDGRNNKLVRLLQMADSQVILPQIYFAETGNVFTQKAEGITTDEINPGETNPGGITPGEINPGDLNPEKISPGGINSEKDDKLPVLLLSPNMENPDDILKEFGLYDCLPIFLRAVFWCLLEYHGSLNIVAPGWEREDFSRNAGRLMYALHCLLPAELRKSAGYRSYAWKENTKTSFYFSREPYGKACFSLDENYPADVNKDQDPLSVYFYSKLADCWKEDRGRYNKLMEELSAYLVSSTGNGMGLKKLQWIFYDLTVEEGEIALPLNYLLKDIPDLMYWGGKEEIFSDITDRRLLEIKNKELTPKEEDLYEMALLDKVSNRSLADVCEEFLRLLSDKNPDASDEAGQTLAMIKEKNEIIYKRIRSNLIDDEEWEQVFMAVEAASQDLRGSEAMGRDLRGSEAMGRDLRDSEAMGRYSSGSEAMGQKASSQRLTDSLEQRPQGTGQKGLSEELVLPLPASAQVPCKQDSRRSNEEAGETIVTRQRELPDQRNNNIPDQGDMQKGKKGRKDKEEVSYRVLDDDKEKGERNRNTMKFLLSSVPTGFLTGCAVFLSHYSLMIGHWKIAVGMGGMWLLLILNYVYLLKSTQPDRHLWMGVGLCILEGELIEIAASYFVAERFRLAYFMILGALAALISILHIYSLLLAQKKKEKKKRQGSGGTTGEGQA